MLEFWESLSLHAPGLPWFSYLKPLTSLGSSEEALRRSLGNEGKGTKAMKGQGTQEETPDAGDVTGSDPVPPAGR